MCSPASRRPHWFWSLSLTGALVSCGGGSEVGVVDAVQLLPRFNQVSTVGGCSEVNDSGFSLTSGPAVQGFDSSARPTKGVALKDTAWGTCIVRLTDHADEAPDTFARNDYSRRQAFNADNSLVLVYALDGAWHVYDANTYAHVKKLWDVTEKGPAGDAEPQWDPKDPDLIHYLPTNGGLSVIEHRVSINTSRVVGNFNGRLPWPDVTHLWTKSEGSPSADGRYWAFMAQATDSFTMRGIVVWDKQTDTIVSTMDATEKPDHLSMSAGGGFVVVSWLDKTVSYDRTLTTFRQIHTTSEHSDLGFGPDGEEVYVSVDYQSQEGVIFMVNLATGVRTDILPTYYGGTATALHISAKAFDKPGWVLVSTYGDKEDRPPGGQQWLHRKIFALELASNPKILNITTTRTVDGDYWTEPQASVNRDFTRVVWTSNWNSLGAAVDAQGLHTDVDTYMVVLPANAIR